MTVTTKEVREALLKLLKKEGCDSEEESSDNEWEENYLDWEDIEELLYSYGNNTIYKHIDGLKISIQEQHGGEGEGDEYFIVLRVESTTAVQFFRVDGRYRSYDGVYWEDEETDPYEVTPIERTYTSWEQK